MYPVPEQFQTLGQELGSPNIALPYFPQPVVYDPELASQLRLVFETLEKIGQSTAARNLGVRYVDQIGE